MSHRGDPLKESKEPLDSWFVISEAALRDALHRVAGGMEPDLMLTEVYANTEASDDEDS